MLCDVEAKVSLLVVCVCFFFFKMSIRHFCIRTENIGSSLRKLPPFSKVVIRQSTINTNEFANINPTSSKYSCHWIYRSKSNIV